MENVRTETDIVLVVEQLFLVLLVELPETFAAAAIAPVVEQL